MKYFKKYLAYTQFSMKRAVQYRVAFVMSYLSGIVQMLILYFIWKQAFLQQVNIAGLTQFEMMTYLFVSQGISNFYGFQTSIERNIVQRIRTGDIALDLIRPSRFDIARFCESLGSMAIQVVLVIITLIILMLLYPEFCLPPNFLTFILFLISVILGYCIMFSISLMTGFIGFITLNISGLYYTRKAIIDLLSGTLIPLWLFPPWAMILSKYLPFKNIIYIPTMIFLGKLEYKEMIWQLIIQSIWAIMLWNLNKIVYKLAMRKVMINGG